MKSESNNVNSNRTLPKNSTLNKALPKPSTPTQAFFIKLKSNSLQLRALSVFIVFIAGLLTLNYFQASEQNKLIQENRESTARLVESNFQSAIDTFRDSMISASYLIRSTYSYEQLAQAATDSEVEAVIDTYLNGAKLDFMFLVNSSGELQLAREYDFYRNISRELHQNNSAVVAEIYKQVNGKTSSEYGIFFVGADPVYVAVNTVKDVQTGLTAYLVVGSYLSTILHHIESNLGVEIGYVFANNVGANNIGANNIGANLSSNTAAAQVPGVVIATIETLLGNPISLSLQFKTSASTSTELTPRWALWGLLFLVAAVVFRQFIYKPVFQETYRIIDELNSIQMNRRYSKRIEVRGQGMFARLTTRINSVLSTLEYAYNLVVKNSQVTSSLIEQVQNHRVTAITASKEQENKNGETTCAEERMHIVSRLSRAIEREEIDVVFQAQYEIIGQSISAVTALARWDDEELGKVPTRQFIALAEDSSLMGPLAEIVMKKACMKAKSWQNAGFKPVLVACKLGSSQFFNKHLITWIASALAAAKLEPRYLELEIKESVVNENLDKSVEILESLGHIGVQLAIDGFLGQGNLKNLSRLPVNKIKLDPSFVADVAEYKKDASLIEGIVKFGNSLGMAVIAAGVETEGQLRVLRASQANVGLQGFYLGRPVSSAQLIPLFSRIDVRRLNVVRR